MERIVFKIDFFTDFTGKIRQVVMAAVSNEKKLTAFMYDQNTERFTTDFIIKEASLGISVQNPSDNVVNPELGKIIAVGKAKKEKSCFGKLMSTDKGFINHKLVEAWLDQEMEYFKQNPGKYIAGYNKDRELFEKDPNLYFKKFN